MLTTNQSEHSDILGAIVTISCDGVDTEHVWDGSTIIIDTPLGIEYTITFSEVENYSTPDSITSRRIEGFSQGFIVEYKCGLVTINVSSDDSTLTEGKVNIYKKIENIIENLEEIEYVDNVSDNYKYRTSADGYVKILDSKTYNKCKFILEIEYDYNRTVGENIINIIPLQNDYIYNVFRCYIERNGTLHFNVYGYSYEARFTAAELANLTKHLTFEISLDTTIKVTVTDSNGKQIIKDISSYSGQVTGAIMLGVPGVSYNARFRFFGLKIYENDSLIHDFKPCKSIFNNDLYIYDNITLTTIKLTNFTAGDIKTKLIDSVNISNTKTIKYPLNDLIYIQAEPVSKYNCLNYKKELLSDANTNINIIYSKVNNGIYIYDKYKRYFTSDEWNTANNNDAVGIALINDNKSFGIWKIDRNAPCGFYYVRWYDGIKYISNINTAKTHYDGESDTKDIIDCSVDYYDDGIFEPENIARKCVNILPIWGKNCYLGSSGEVYLMGLNAINIKTISDLIGGTLSTPYYIISSTFKEIYSEDTDTEAYFTVSGWYTQFNNNNYNQIYDGILINQTYSLDTYETLDYYETDGTYIPLFPLG